MSRRLPIRSQITLVLAGPTSTWLILGLMILAIGIVAWCSGGAL